ncbi:MAG: hypothetical protein WC069_05405 [Candidatus Shapirobacteria bacterium]
MSNIKLINKIKSGEVKMKPKWQFEVKKWAEIGLWLMTIIAVVVGVMGIAYFMTIYNISELSEFGDLGWQIFYEDFPYIWGITAIFSLIAGILVMINTGHNYKKSWQQNLMIMSAIILVLTIGALFLNL